MDMIGAIYEAAMLPEYWPTALTDVCKTIGAEACTLVTVDARVPRWTCSEGFAERMQIYLDGGWHEKNRPMETLLKSGRIGFVRDIDLFSLSEVENLPIVKDLKRPAGLGWSAAMATPMPNGEMLLFSVEQLWASGPISARSMQVLETLRPHISRAALLAAKLRHERAVAAVESLALAGVPAALVSGNLSVVAANQAFMSFSGQISVGARDRLRVAVPLADDLVRAALSRPFTDMRTAPMSVAIPAVREGETPLVVHIVPTQGRARDLLGDMTSLVIVTKLGVGAAPDASLLRALFDLSPAESRVCEAILAGISKAEMLKLFGITAETEKSHVKAILRKTGLESRLGLVRFMSGIRL